MSLFLAVVTVAVLVAVVRVLYPAVKSTVDRVGLWWQTRLSNYLGDTAVLRANDVALTPTETAAWNKLVDATPMTWRAESW